ncbi:MAG: GNAT family N-acetyltransferase [Eubacteriales bacterium]|nr:GNAT family N-acetyltransferase [Eubacteriales bacterium]
MMIRKVEINKKKYLALLLLADEQEDMIDKYLARGEMFVLDDGGVKAECVVTKEGDGVYELRNIAVAPDCRHLGYGKRLIDHVFPHYADCRTLYAGTGDVPSSLCFYRKCGFVLSHRVKDFFTDNYGHVMMEDGKQLVDMVYLKRER